MCQLADGLFMWLQSASLQLFSLKFQIVDTPVHIAEDGVFFCLYKNAIICKLVLFVCTCRYYISTSVYMYHIIQRKMSYFTTKKSF